MDACMLTTVEKTTVLDFRFQLPLFNSLLQETQIKPSRLEMDNLKLKQLEDKKNIKQE
jgi:hypothetical protein